MFTEEDLQDGFRIGEYEVLPKRHVIRKGKEEQSPEPKVFGVLMSLARRNGDDVSRDELIDEVWDGRPTADGPIARAITQLRGHFEDRQRPYRYVQAKHKIGYHLVQPVALLEDEPAPQAPRGDNALWQAIAGAAIAILLALVIWILWRPDVDATDAIGVLPFDVASDVSGDEHIAVGLKEELLRALVSADGPVIKNGRVRYPDLDVPEIADHLDVTVVVSVTLLRDGENLEVAWRAESGRDSSLIASDSVRGIKGEMLQLQRMLVASVMNGLFPGARQELITESRSTGAGIESYYLGLYAIERRGEPGNLMNAIEHFQAAIRLDPSFGPAYLSLATAYALLPDLENAPLEESHRLAIQTIEEGVKVDRSIADASGAIYGHVYHKQKRWKKAEEAYQRAINARVVDSNAFNWYSRMLASVGRLDASVEEALKAQRIDPDSAIVNSRLAIAYAWIGDSANAAEFFERSRYLGVRGSTHLLANALFLARIGQLESARQLTTVGVRMQGANSDWIDPVFAAFAEPSRRDDALAAVNTASDAGELAPQIEIIVRTMLGDTDRAMDIAELLKSPGEMFEIDLLFVPETKPLRDHPRFNTLLEDLGIKDYWKSRGCQLIEDSVVCDQRPDQKL